MPNHRRAWFWSKTRTYRRYTSPWRPRKGSKVRLALITPIMLRLRTCKESQADWSNPRRVNRPFLDPKIHHHRCSKLRTAWPIPRMNALHTQSIGLRKLSKWMPLLSLPIPHSSTIKMPSRATRQVLSFVSQTPVRFSSKTSAAQQTIPRQFSKKV